MLYSFNHFINDGSGYTSTPTVFISTSRSSSVVQMLCCSDNDEIGGFSIKELILQMLVLDIHRHLILILSVVGEVVRLQHVQLKKQVRGVISVSMLLMKDLGYTSPPVLTKSHPVRCRNNCD